jgi:hypothetical protein
MSIFFSINNNLVLFSLVWLLICTVSQPLDASETHFGKKNDILVATPNNLFSSLKDGQPTGVIAEATAYILKKMGYDMRFVSMHSKDIKKSVKSGFVDVGAGMLILPGGSKSVLKSDPVVVEYNVVMTRKDEKFDFLELIKNGRQGAGSGGWFSGKHELGARVGFKYPLLVGNTAITLQRNLTDGDNVRKLLLGDLNAIIVGGVSDLHQFQAEGIMYAAKEPHH